MLQGIKLHLFIFISLILLPIFLECYTTRERREGLAKRKLIVLSIDGFPGYYTEKDSPFYSYTPNLNKLREKAIFSNQVTSVYPTLTYPAHTSMITGSDPSAHGILFNNPIDPFRKYSGGWMWYDEDIKVQTLTDIAKSYSLTTGSVYWPVTVGANIDYNIPQYWKSKTDEDEKLLKALSTKGLYNLIKKETGMSVTELTGDKEKIEAAITLWKIKQPDILLIYTTDLDTVHHEKGVYSPEAGEKLKTIDRLLGRLISKLDITDDPNIGFIIVSDHGFKEVKSLCYPNRLMVQEGHLDTKSNKWSYYFKTLGGMAILLKNTGDDRLARDIDKEALGNRLKLECPDLIFSTSGKDFDEIKTKLEPKIEAAVFSNVNMVFSESTSPGELFRESNPTYYNHGFLPTDKEMKTIGLFYPRESGLEINDLKDVFFASCKWMGMECKNSKR